MEQMLKVAAIGLIGALAALCIKSRSPEMALMASIASALVIAFAAMELFAPIRDFLDELTGISGISPTIITPLIKVAGVSIITKISCEICRDAKEMAVASAIEISGALAGIYLVLPLLSSVLKLVARLF